MDVVLGVCVPESVVRFKCGEEVKETSILKSNLGVSVPEEQGRIFLLFGLLGVEKLEESREGEGATDGGHYCVLPKSRLTGENVRPLDSTKVCLSTSCFFLPASFLYCFRQLG